MSSAPTHAGTHAAPLVPLVPRGPVQSLKTGAALTASSADTALSAGTGVTVGLDGTARAVRSSDLVLASYHTTNPPERRDR